MMETEKLNVAIVSFSVPYFETIFGVFSEY
jgi:hypothetical protein